MDIKSKVKYKEILLAPNQLEYAILVGKKRISNAYKRKYYNQNDSVVGAVGEYAYSLFTNMPFDDTIYNTGDGGVDFPDGTDVKTSTFTGYNVELKVGRKYDTVKKYVLAQYNPTINPHKVTLVGEISSDNFWKKCKQREYRPGSKTNYVTVKELDRIYN